MTQDEITKWLARFSRAQDLQKQHAEARRQAIKLYTGTYFNQPTADDDEFVDVNFVYEFVDLLLSSIYAKNPYLFVRTDFVANLSFAQTMEKVVNYYWREKEVKNKMKKTMRDAILQPPGWIGAGFFLETDKQKTKRILEQEFPELKTPNGNVEEQEGILDETIKRGDLFINYKNSWDVVWPDGYNDIRSAPYLFVIERTNLEDVLNNPIYKSSKHNLAGINRTGYVTRRPTSATMKNLVKIPVLPNSNASVVDPELTSIRLIHVWDRRGQQVFTLAEGYPDDTLFGPKAWDYLPDGFPFFPLIFNEIPQTEDKANSYPLSDVTPMIPLLKNLSRFMSLMLRHGKRMGGVLLYETGGVTTEQMAQIAQSDDLDAIEVSNMTKLQTFMFPAVPNDWFKLKQEILQDLFRISGMKQLLADSTGVDTATESENIREGGRVRQINKVDVVEDYTVRIARYVAGLAWQFLDRKQVEEIIAEPVSDQMWPDLPRFEDGTIDMSAARKVIQKELHFRIEAGSTRPPKDEFVEQKIFGDQVGIIMANFPGRVKPDVLAEALMKKMKIPEAEQAIIRFDEEEIAAAEQENTLLLKGIPVPVSPNQNHELHIKVHSTMPPTETGDQHLMHHAHFMQMMSPIMGPQKGDNKAPLPTTTPDFNRQGVTEYSDILGSVNSMRGTGVNTGGPQK